MCFCDPYFSVFVVVVRVVAAAASSAAAAAAVIAAAAAVVVAVNQMKYQSDFRLSCCACRMPGTGQSRLGACLVIVLFHTYHSAFSCDISAGLRDSPLHPAVFC